MRDFLKKTDPLVIKDKISVKYELAKKMLKNDGRSMIFENIKEKKMKIVAGICSNRDLLALSANTTKDKLIKIVGKAIESSRECKVVKDAPFLANKHKNPNVSEILPLPVFYADKQYLSSSIVIVKDPETGRRNASFHRMMYLGGNKFVIRLIPQRDLHNFYNKAIEMDKDLEIKIVIGVHPCVELGAATSYPGLDELKFASELMGGLEVYELNGVGVPASAEIVMEGRITRKEHEEGPFVDLTGTADKVRMQPILEIDTLYHRDDSYFRVILPGKSEHRILMGIPQEPRIFKLVSNTIPTVKNVVMSVGGGCWLHGVVQIEKRTPGDAKNTILAALAAHPSMKRVVIVDVDVDPSDPTEVEWAIATRVQADKDVVMFPGTKGSSLDPSAGEKSITCKWGIDATKPLNAEGYDKVI